MSQIYKSGISGPVPPSVATSYVTDINSPAVPALNILNVLGNDTSSNNNNGIRTDGSSGSNTLTVQLTNRLQGTVTTNDATLTTLITFALPAAGVYAFDINIASFNTTDVLGASYSVFVGIRGTGAAAVKLNLEDKIVNEEVGDTACNASVAVSGNSVLFQVTGIAGKTVNWNAVGSYVFVGA